jgi:uncharacterized membrane protein HdeD (DUF308 family)
MKKENANKGLLIMGVIGLIACIVSIVMVITNPSVTTYQEFFSRSWLTILFFIMFVLPAIVSNISAFSGKSK